MSRNRLDSLNKMQVLHLDSSSSSQDKCSPRGRKGPPRTNEDNLRDMNFDPPKFEGTLNPDVYLKWIQTLERFFEVKVILMKIPLKWLFLNLKSTRLFGMRIPKRKEPKKGSHRSQLGPS